MFTINTLALHVSGTVETGWFVEAVAKCVGFSAPLVREHYGPLSREELTDVVDQLISQLRPGVGFYEATRATQLEFPLGGRRAT